MKSGRVQSGSPYRYNRPRLEYANNPGIIIQIAQSMMNEMGKTLSQIITHKVRHMHLPEKHKNLGRISMTFTNLHVTEITPPRIEIHPSPHTPYQITASMQGLTQ
ncbi:hypothetical protein M514_21618 [Trichuris suis]|uniref:Uncharacterized protein n=1 Tax=Trichuris suis TaxID=68888 RepID=A0A085NA35_9BILA|nr:hypothetical protein M514_09505 [Trichuris suis]KFD66331.1 hypothetical protein M514_21618 [Trichuris suis]